MTRTPLSPSMQPAPRLLPNVELPAYAYVSGAGIPHPYRHPEGHSYGQRQRPAPPPLDPERWDENHSYLYGLDLFNNGYYWEAHDEWDRLLKATGADTLAGLFLKGLLKMAAAGIKVRENSIHGVRRHAASAGEVFADVAAETNEDYFCGLVLTEMQFAADRAAQLVYKKNMPPGKPIRVFPFALIPRRRPLSESSAV